MYCRASLAIAALCLPLAACGGPDGARGSGADRTVAAAFYPLAFVAERVAGDAFEVVNLTHPGVEPHDLELGVRETGRIADADLVLFEGGFQPAVDAAVENATDAPALDAAEVLELRPLAGHEHEGADEHDRDELDPHFWLDPLLMADLADEVATELAELDPGSADELAGRAADLRADLEALDQEYDEGLTRCARDTVVVNHDAFGYLERYGLNFEPIAGLSPDAEPTPADLARLHRLIRDEDITTVFSETLVSKRTAETLASDLGVTAGVLDPLEGLSSDESGADYLSVMRANLAELEEANGC